ncbi:D-alanyl-D-alanine carboxypeptidase family protein [Brevibacterium mcbrellneri]|uniref:D-alanyl-D-alanine carboxypeptidase family protein n=1 Tax=Brevibacterium mcbrellneri TaxID=53363 RepID=UPI0006819249|nr:serine hydrolase [Brevibacterium mcbrellneri]
MALHPLTCGRRFLAAATVALATFSVVGPTNVVGTEPASAHTVVAQPAETTSATYTSPTDLGDGTSPPKPAADAWLVANLDTGEVLVSHGEDVVSSPASVQKLLTALALVDELPDVKKKHRISEADTQVDGTRVGLLRDNEYSIDLLFRSMLMSSANDSAYALGEAVGGQHKALELMHRKARQLGMDSTVVGTTSGLDAPGQGTTIDDLLRLAHEFTKNKYLMKVVQTQTLDFPGGYDHDKKKKVKGYQIQNHTRLIGLVEGAIGLKNGYTQEARGSFLGAATRGDTTYAAVVLRAQTQSRQAAADLLNWAFNQTDPKVTRTVAFEDLSTPSPVASPAASAGTSDSGAESSSSDARSGTESDISVEEMRESQPAGAAIPANIGLALGLPVAVFAVAGGILMYRSRHSRSGNSRSRRGEEAREDQEGTGR